MKSRRRQKRSPSLRMVSTKVDLANQTLLTTTILEASDCEVVRIASLSFPQTGTWLNCPPLPALRLYLQALSLLLPPSLSWDCLIGRATVWTDPKGAPKFQNLSYMWAANSFISSRDTGRFHIGMFLMGRFVIGRFFDGQVRHGQVCDGQVRHGQVCDGQVRDGQIPAVWH